MRPACAPTRRRTGRQAFLEIEERMVSENIFSQFMYKTLATSCHVWTFKKQFCAQMALSGAGPRARARCPGPLPRAGVHRLRRHHGPGLAACEAMGEVLGGVCCVVHRRRGRSRPTAGGGAAALPRWPRVRWTTQHTPPTTSPVAVPHGQAGAVIATQPAHACAHGGSAPRACQQPAGLRTRRRGRGGAQGWCR